MEKNLLSKNIRRLRLRQGYTQEQFANKIGVSTQAVSRWECGTTLPDALLLPKLAKICETTVDDLFQEEIFGYPNYAQRLLAVYEASGRTEDFVTAEQEFFRLFVGEHSADDLRACGVLYHYMMTSCKDQALHYLNAAIKKSKDDKILSSKIIQQRIALLCELGHSVEVINEYQKALDCNPKDEYAWYFCIVAYHLAGKNSTSLNLTKQAITLFPNNPILLGYAGDICKDLGDHKTALSYWKQALEVDPTYWDAIYSIGECLEELAQYYDSYEIWNDLLKKLMQHGITHECNLVKKHIQFCEEKICKKVTNL